MKVILVGVNIQMDIYLNVSAVTVGILQAAVVGKLEGIEQLEQLRALENGMTIYAKIVDTIKLIEGAPADINTLEELLEAQKYMK